MMTDYKPTCVTDDQFITALEYIGEDVESFAELLDMKQRWESYLLMKNNEGVEFERTLYSMHKVVQSIVQICIDEGYIEGKS